MGEVYYIFGDKNIPRAQVAFSSLVRAMNEFTRKTEGKRRSYSHSPGLSQSEADDDHVTHDPVLAVVRLVSSDNSPPKMGVAFAVSTKKMDYMLWVRVRKCVLGLLAGFYTLKCPSLYQMPFAEDLRRFVFPSLDIIKDKHGKPKSSHRFIPTPAMQRSMDDLVQSGDLLEAGPKNDKG